MSDWKTHSIIESSIEIEKDRELRHVFNDALIHHLIQFESNDGDPDVETRIVKYRVKIEVVDDTH